ncbi:MAG: hypothetical protein EOL87_11325 [Spartobacteria bacterium]|nr:hypothetical protein [Spartobacteria bacterium]
MRKYKMVWMLWLVGWMLSVSFCRAETETIVESGISDTVKVGGGKLLAWKTDTWGDLGDINTYDPTSSVNEKDDGSVKYNWRLAMLSAILANESYFGTFPTLNRTEMDWNYVPSLPERVATQHKVTVKQSDWSQMGLFDHANDLDAFYGVHHCDSLYQVGVLASVQIYDDAATLYNASTEELTVPIQLAIQTASFEPANGNGARVIVVTVRGIDDITDTPSQTYKDIPYDYWTVVLGYPYRPFTSDALKDVAVHAGYYAGADWIRNNESDIMVADVTTLAQEIAAIKNGSRPNDIMLLVGHNTGGAIASLYAFELRRSGFPEDQLIVYTFGAPRVGNDAYINYLNSQGDGGYFKQVACYNEKDGFPQIGKSSALNRLPADPVVVHKSAADYWCSDTPGNGGSYYANGHMPQTYMRNAGWRVKGAVKLKYADYATTGEFNQRTIIADILNQTDANSASDLQDNQQRFEEVKGFVKAVAGTIKNLADLKSASKFLTDPSKVTGSPVYNVLKTQMGAAQAQSTAGFALFLVKSGNTTIKFAGKDDNEILGLLASTMEGNAVLASAEACAAAAGISGDKTIQFNADVANDMIHAGSDLVSGNYVVLVCRAVEIGADCVAAVTKEYSSTRRTQFALAINFYQAFFIRYGGDFEAFALDFGIDPDNYSLDEAFAAFYWAQAPNGETMFSVDDALQLNQSPAARAARMFAGLFGQNSGNDLRTLLNQVPMLAYSVSDSIGMPFPVSDSSKCWTCTVSPIFAQDYTLDYARLAYMADDGTTPIISSGQSKTATSIQFCATFDTPREYDLEHSLTLTPKKAGESSIVGVSTLNVRPYADPSDVMDPQDLYAFSLQEAELDPERDGWVKMKILIQLPLHILTDKDTDAPIPIEKDELNLKCAVFDPSTSSRDMNDALFVTDRLDIGASAGDAVFYVSAPINAALRNYNGTFCKLAFRYVVTPDYLEKGWTWNKLKYVDASEQVLKDLAYTLPAETTPAHIIASDNDDAAMANTLYGRPYYAKDKSVYITLEGSDLTEPGAAVQVASSAYPPSGNGMFSAMIDGTVQADGRILIKVPKEGYWAFHRVVNPSDPADSVALDEVSRIYASSAPLPTLEVAVADVSSAAANDTSFKAEAGDTLKLRPENDPSRADFAALATPVTVVADVNTNLAPVGMAAIPGGTFVMGGEGYTEHNVTLSPFYMDKTEVTNDEMIRVMQWAYNNGKLYVTTSTVKNNSGNQQELLDLNDSDCRITWDGSSFGMKDAKGSGYPCVEVTWYGACAYANYRSEMEGLTPCYDLSDWSCNWSASGYRLPTEAEWEYAARGGLSGQRFPWGDTITHQLANYYSSSSYSYDTSATRGYHPDWDDGGYPYTSPVGTFAPNGYGLYDMAGNLWEWCNDWYSSSYYSSSTSTDPTGPTTGSCRV